MISNLLTEHHTHETIPLFNDRAYVVSVCAGCIFLYSSSNRQWPHGRTKQKTDAMRTRHARPNSHRLGQYGKSYHL